MLHQTTSTRKGPLLSKQELALVGITAIWGTTFLIVHLAVQHSDPLFFVGVRFLIAGVIAALVFARALRGMTWRDLGAGAAIGLMIYLGYGLQTIGLLTIPSSTSAFITALYVPMVPLLQWAVFRKAPKWATWVGIALAFGGLLLLAGPTATGLSLGTGELLTLISTVAIAGEIILVAIFARTVDVRRVTVVQLLVAGALALLTMPVTGESIPAFSWGWLLPAIVLGAASALIQLTINWAQQTVSPTRATVIYAAEPVWAGIIGRVAGERLPGLAIVGALFIVAGVLVSELKPRLRRPIEAARDEVVVGTTAQNESRHLDEDRPRRRRARKPASVRNRRRPRARSTDR